MLTNPLPQVLMLAIYTRLSVDSEDSNSIEYQKREGKDFAKSRNLNFKIYDEGSGVSGTRDIKDRPKLTELIYDVKKGDISKIWMRNQDRLDRNTLTFFIFVEAVRDANVEVYFGNGDMLDFNDPNTLLHTSILSSLNAYQAGIQGVKTKRVLKDNVKQGKAWGILPYGYCTDEEMKLMVEEEEALIVERIFKEYLAGKGGKAISSGLNEEKIPTRYNKYKDTEIRLKNKYTKKVSVKKSEDVYWVERTVMSILQNRWYIGERKYSGDTYPVPRIISDLFFNKVQDEIKKRKGKHSGISKYNYLLKGLIRCGKCGRNYYGKTRSDKSENYYMCSSYRMKETKCGNLGVNIPKIESFMIKHLFRSKDLMNYLQLIQDNNVTINKFKEELNGVEDELRKCRLSVNKYAKLLGDELSDDELILKLYKETNLKLKELEKKQSILVNEIEIATSKKGLIDYSNIYENMQSKVDFETIRDAVNQIVNEIVVDTNKDSMGKVVVTLKISYKNLNLQSSENMMWLSKRPLDKWDLIYTVKSDTSLSEELRNFAEVQGLFEHEHNIGHFESIYLEDSDLYNFNK